METTDKNLKKKIDEENIEVKKNPKEPEIAHSSTRPLNKQRSKISHNSIKEVKPQEWFTMTTLIFINLVNYIDRYTVAAVIEAIQHDFKISNSKAGLFQTVFLLSYTFAAPLLGYLGDRYNRKLIIISCVFIWSVGTLACSFMNEYLSFLAFRAIVGMGEAGFSTITPTIIGDIFSDRVRTQMLTSFYLAMPFGSGLGYIVGSEMAKVGESWHWGLRLTPALGAVAVVMVLFFMENPERGKSEGITNLKTTSWIENMKYLLKNRSFVYATLATTCASFVVGGLAWWGDKFIKLGFRLHKSLPENVLHNSTIIFGSVAMGAGIAGLVLGSYLSQLLRRKHPNVDPLICGMGLVLATPFVIGASYAATYSATLCFVCLFLAEAFMSVNCAVVNDILLYVTIPTRRSTAEGIHLLVTHALGDAGSPFVVGLITDALKRMYKKLSKNDTKEWIDFKALQYALFVVCFINLLGAYFFYLCSLHILQDKDAVDSVAEVE